MSVYILIKYISCSVMQLLNHVKSPSGDAFSSPMLLVLKCRWRVATLRFAEHFYRKKRRSGTILQGMRLRSAVYTTKVGCYCRVSNLFPQQSAVEPFSCCCQVLYGELPLYYISTSELLDWQTSPPHSSGLGSVSIPFPFPSEGRCESLHVRLKTKPHSLTGHMGIKIDITFY